MKFLKKNQINYRNISDNNLAVQVDGEVTMDTTNALLVPKGNNSQRPLTSVTGDLNGMIRYTSDYNGYGDPEFEMRKDNEWRRVRFNEPGLITQQGPWLGDDIEEYFGPLDSEDPRYPVPELDRPQNIMVYVENVFQISTTNYTLVDNPPGAPSAAFYGSAVTYPAGRYVKFDTPVPYGKPVTVIHGFDR